MIEITNDNYEQIMRVLRKSRDPGARSAADNLMLAGLQSAVRDLESDNEVRQAG